jgi:hypothetical protein
MMSARKKLLAIAAAVTICATSHSGALFAQTSGIGGDGITRVLWRGTDSSISLWALDSNLNFITSHAYGPFPGWFPIAITTDSNNFTYVLWRNSDGAITLWLVNPSLNFLTSTVYGPFAGWLAEGLSVSTNGSNNFRVLWRHSTGALSVWNVDGNLNLVNSNVYGPFFGYDPGSAKE